MSAITVTGNLTSHPELRFLPSGRQVASFTVAENHRQRVDGEWRDAGTTFWPVSVWGPQAENVAESLARGTRVTVQGSAKDRAWETADGEKRHRVEITANEVSVSLKFATAEVTRGERHDDSSTWDPEVIDGELV